MQYFVLDHPLSESRMESSEQVGTGRILLGRLMSPGAAAIWAMEAPPVTSTVDGEDGQLGSHLVSGQGSRARHVTGALHGPKRRRNLCHGSAPGPSTAHKPHGQPPCRAAGRARVGPTEEGEASFGPVPGKFLGRVGQDPSDSKSNRLNVDIFQFCYIHLRYVSWNLLKRSVNYLKF